MLMRMPSRKVISKKMSEYLSVISHPDRFRIIEEIGDRELDVNEITKILGIPQSSVSQHLSALRSKDLVVDRREGKHIFYSLRFPWMAGWLLEGLKLLEEAKSSDHELLTATAEVKKLWGRGHQ